MDNNQNHSHLVAAAVTVVRAVRTTLVTVPYLSVVVIFGCTPQAAEKPSAAAPPQPTGTITTPAQGKQTAMDAIDKSSMSPEEKQAMKERMSKMSKNP